MQRIVYLLHDTTVTHQCTAEICLFVHTGIREKVQAQEIFLTYITTNVNTLSITIHDSFLAILK